MEGVVKNALLCVVLWVGVAAAKGGVGSQTWSDSQGSYVQLQEAQAQPVESVIGSEVEYVDGPLAPLYDFLIQRKLYKFCKLLRDAALEDTLLSHGGYWTVFVPTDSSFIFLPGGTLENMKRNPRLLRDFLLYHFVTGDLPSSQILNEMLVETLQEAPLRFNIYGEIMTVSGAQIVEPDLEFELGRVHIIDQPLYSMPQTDTVSYLKKSHQKLYRLLLDSNLQDYLSSGTFTVLAPEDTAFDFLSTELKDAISSNRSLAEKILLNHILPASIYVAGITDGMQLETVGGTMITFTIKRGLIFANGIPIILPDVPFTNGVIQVLNRVLLPEGVEADCQCKTSSSKSPQQPNTQLPGSRITTQRPQVGRPSTTRRPQGPPLNRQTPRTNQQNVPRGAQPTSQPRISPQQPQRQPFSPSRIDGPSRQAQPTSLPLLRPVIQPETENELNLVVGADKALTSGPKRPDQNRATRYPTPPPRRGNTPQVPAAFIPTQDPADNNNNIDQGVSFVTNPPRQTPRWTNRQPSQPSRYPTPARGVFQNPSTTGRPQNTRSQSVVTPAPVIVQPGSDVFGQQPSPTPQQIFQPSRPVLQPSSWQQRNPNNGQTTSRPFRNPPGTQRQPAQQVPRNQISSSLPQSTGQSNFESNRQRLNCRQRNDRITTINQNLPICPESVGTNECQSPPYSPTDSRPLCPNDVQLDCRTPNEPFNPSDTRPLCSSPTSDQNCRIQGQPTYNGDRRPFCSNAPARETGCRNPSEPLRPNDNRPICSNQLNQITPEQVQQPQNCRRSNEVQDGRPLCPNEIQADCRPFNERPRAGDRRPICRTNAPRHDPMKGQQRGNVPSQRPTSSNSPTTRRPTWQQTTRLPQSTIRPISPPGQRGNVLPASNNRQRPSVGVNPNFITQSPPSSRPSNPQVESELGSPPQPQVESHSQRVNPRPLSPGFDVTRTNISPPTSRTTFVPSIPFVPRSQPPLPQFGVTEALPLVNPNQPPITPNRQPLRPAITPSIRPAIGQPVSSQRPGSPQQVTRVTSPPGRGTTSSRAPISVTGTSTTPGEDSRRTLYEIVEDPALLIRGRPVKLTKAFSLFHTAGIEDILTGPGPTTVFLPSDDAFATLPKGVVEQLEENPELLRQILLYHVANVEILPSPQSESYTVPSLEGNQLVITMLNGGRLILISGAKAIAVTRANNGIFYVINQLLYPLPQDNIVLAIQSRPDLSTLSWLLPLSGLAELLQGQTPYTFLAPTDTAFAQLPPTVYDELTQNTTALQEVLLNHIIEGAHYGREFLTGGTFPSARGGKLKFQVVSYGYQVNDVNIKTPEIVTGTGVIHLIDQLLLEDSDLRYFNKLENAVIDQNLPSTSSPQSPSLQPQQFQRQPQTSNGSRRSARGQPTGLQPPSNPSSGHRQPSNQIQPAGQRQPGGQILPNGQRQPTGQVQPNSLRQPIGQQQPSSLRQHTGQLQPNGQRHPIVQLPPTGQTKPTGPRTPNVQVVANRQPSFTGHTTFGGQRTAITVPPTSDVSSQTGQRLSNPSRQVPSRHQAQASPEPNNNIGGQPNSVADLAKSMGLNRFANWITNTGLLEKVHDGGVYTVFAPTDDAVNSLPQDMVNSIDSNPQQTKSLLMYHIVPRKLNLNSINNEETTNTLLQGKPIRFNVYETGQPNCKPLVTASGTPIGDALATMGSVQLIPITQVLYQPTGHLLNIIDASPILQSLSEAIKNARISWILSGTGPLTFFAPSDTAFQSLTPDERKTLIEDKQAFSDLIKRHLIRGTYFSSGVQEDLKKNNEKGESMAITLQEGILTVNKVPVTFSDITATNGVLHVVDQFL